MAREEATGAGEMVIELPGHRRVGLIAMSMPGLPPGSEGSRGGIVFGLPPGVKVFLACGRTDMRKGMDGLAMQVQAVLRQDPFSGHVFCFRGRRGDDSDYAYFNPHSPDDAAILSAPAYD